MEGKFTFLGTGGSTGIPVIGCSCPVCTSSSPFNRRLRPSGLLHFDNKRIVIDTGPDFREQALRVCLDNVDGILYTHSHYDHIAGIDELRAYYLKNKQELKALVSNETFEDLKRRYYYIFEESSDHISLSARLTFQILPHSRGKVDFLEIPIQYMSYSQGGMSVVGYRIGNFAYLTDIRDFPSTIYEDLKGVQKLVISAIRHKPSFMHFSVEEALNFAEHCGAKEIWFTHISHELDHDSTNRLLPKGAQLAYDGCSLIFEY